jgi:hypothetical protein
LTRARAKAHSTAPIRAASIIAALGSRDESVTLCLFAGLHLPKDALALHLLLENPESLIHIVFANEYLQMFSDLVVTAAP